MGWLALVCLMAVAGTLGRMGGSDKWDTKWRDLGVPAVLLVATGLLVPFVGEVWWAYAATFILSFGALTTYWDELFGYDCMWFSGLVVGLAAIPLCFIDPIFCWLVPIRAVVLAGWWQFLNKKLPQDGFLVWRRDVAEEFLRYAVTL